MTNLERTEQKFQELIDKQPNEVIKHFLTQLSQPKGFVTQSKTQTQIHKGVPILHQIDDLADHANLIAALKIFAMFIKEDYTNWAMFIDRPDLANDLEKEIEKLTGPIKI